MQLQRAAHVAQPPADLGVAEVEGDVLAAADAQPAEKARAGKVAKRRLRRFNALALLALDLPRSLRVERGFGVRRALGEPLDIGHESRPLAAVAQIDAEKRVDLRQIVRQEVVIDPSGAQRAARHEKNVLHVVLDRAEQLVGEVRAGDVIKAISLAAEG